ncbi:ABC transporter substrate-binding protein, partial [Bordetella holmesii]
MKRVLLTTLAAALVAAAAPVSAENLSIGFADPLSSLDPQLNNHAGDRSVALHFWDLLVENKWNKLQPGLALFWKPLDSTTWEFKLRPGVKWQDGTPFTADDLIYSYTRARAVPGSVATYAGYLRTIESMSAPDPLTFVVKTKTPNPDLPLNLASVHVVSKHVG